MVHRCIGSPSELHSQSPPPPASARPASDIQPETGNLSTWSTQGVQSLLIHSRTCSRPPPHSNHNYSSICLMPSSALFLKTSFFNDMCDVYKHKLLVKTKNYIKSKVKAASFALPKAHPSPQSYQCLQGGGHFPTSFSMYLH